MDTIKTLVVEDMEPILKRYCQILVRDEHIEVVGAAQNGYQAVMLAVTEKPDVILMDYYWPEHARKKYGDRERGGEISMDTLRQIRQALPDLPVISYTIKPDREVLDSAYANGVTFFLEKVAMAVPEVHNALKYIIIYLMRNKSGWN